MAELSKLSRYEMSGIPIIAANKQDAIEAKRLMIEIFNTYQIEASTIISAHKVAMENKDLINSCLADLKKGTSIELVLVKNISKLKKLVKK
jgi:hypothetical protein